MSLDVALQSVAFYVLSCSTCAKISHRRKAKIQAKRERAEKQELETQQPGLYRHPSPFSTNPYWSEEISMGPGPPKKKGDKGGSKSASTRALNTAGPGSSYASSGAVGTDVSTDPGSSPTAVTEGSRISGEGWNLKRYQREDEALWGHGDAHGPGQRFMDAIDAIAKAGSSAGRLIESRLSKSGALREENPKSYYIAKNPPVNDLHPPVVSTQPTHRDQTRWMLQPPPSAKIMEGKERVTSGNRSRSVSAASKKALDGTPLSRQVTERLVEAKLQRGESPFPESRTTSRPESRSKTPALPTGQRHDRDRSTSPDSSDSLDSGIKRKRRPPPIATAHGARKSKDVAEHIPIPANDVASSETLEPEFRPRLSTMLSSSSGKSKEQGQLPLRELDNTLNSSMPSPSRRLSPQANAMPASIPSENSKFTAAQSSMLDMFPKPVSQENEQPARS